MAKVKQKVTKLEEELMQSRAKIRKYQINPLIVIVVGFGGFFFSGFISSFVNGYAVSSFIDHISVIFWFLILVGIVLLIIGQFKLGNNLADVLKSLSNKNGLFVVIGDIINGQSVLKSGVEGEAKALKILSKLPDSFTVIPDYSVKIESGSSQLDFIVASQKAIWIVENKNMNGRINGRLDDQNWQQHKVGRGGTPYGKTFYNPTKQVKTHVYRLNQYLYQNGYKNVHIQGVVYFSNDDVYVEVNGDEQRPVIQGNHALIDYLLIQDQKYNQTMQNGVVDFLWNSDF